MVCGFDITYVMRHSIAVSLGRVGVGASTGLPVNREDIVTNVTRCNNL